jgi:hypothetical protein
MQRSQTNSYVPDYILQCYASWLWCDEVNADKTQQLLSILQAKPIGGQVSTTSRDIVGHLRRLSGCAQYCANGNGSRCSLKSLPRESPDEKAGAYQLPDSRAHIQENRS